MSWLKLFSYKKSYEHNEISRDTRFIKMQLPLYHLQYNFLVSRHKRIQQSNHSIKLSRTIHKSNTVLSFTQRYKQAWHTTYVIYNHSDFLIRIFLPIFASYSNNKNTIFHQIEYFPFVYKFILHRSNEYT